MKVTLYGKVGCDKCDAATNSPSPLSGGLRRNKMICKSIKDTVSESFRVADCRDCIGSVQGCEVYAEVERLTEHTKCTKCIPMQRSSYFQDKAEKAEAEVERLKEAWESAELRADDGWREVERIGGERDILAEKVKQQEAEIDELRVSTEDCKNRLEIAKRIAAMMRSEIVELKGKIDAAGRGEGE